LLSDALLHWQAVKHEFGINLDVGSRIYASTGNKIIGSVGKATGRTHRKAWAASEVEVVILSYGSRYQQIADENNSPECDRD
jgi:hypothetical protein